MKTTPTVATTARTILFLISEQINKNIATNITITYTYDWSIPSDSKNVITIIFYMVYEQNFAKQK